MCEPVYSKNNVNFRLPIVYYKNLTLSIKVVKTVTGFEHLYMPLGPTIEAKICPWNDMYGSQIWEEKSSAQGLL